MEQAVLTRLKAAQRRVKLGQDQIDRQRMVVATLFASGHDTTEAENRLRVYQKLHANYLADMERISNALKTMPADLVRLYDSPTFPAYPRSPTVMSARRNSLPVDEPPERRKPASIGGGFK